MAKPTFHTSNRAKCHAMAALFMSGSYNIDSDALILFGASVRTANTWLVQACKAGYLTRLGKRGEGYEYSPTIHFWKAYQDIAIYEHTVWIAKLLTSEADLPTIRENAANYDGPVQESLL